MTAVRDFFDHWLYVVLHPVETWRWHKTADDVYGDWRDQPGNYGE